MPLSDCATECQVSECVDLAMDEAAEADRYSLQNAGQLVCVLEDDYVT